MNAVIISHVYQLTFWAAIVFTALGGLLGLVGVWVPEFWNSETALKLILTDMILAGTSVTIAAMTKWLSSET